MHREPRSLSPHESPANEFPSSALYSRLLPVVSATGRLDVHWPRSMCPRAVAELAIQIVAPTKRLAGHSRAAGVRAKRADRRERVSTDDSNRLRLVGRAASSKLPVCVTSPAKGVPIRSDGTCMHTAGRNRGKTGRTFHTHGRR